MKACPYALFWTPKLSLSPFPLCSWLWAAELRVRLPGLFFCLFHGTSDPGKDLHKMPIPLKSPKQDWSRTLAMLGMSFPAVDWGVKLCFQSQHYKWALLSDQIAAKSISLQTRWCSGSWKGHGLNHLQVNYCHEGNATAEGLRGKNLMCISLFLEILHPALQPAELPFCFEVVGLPTCPSPSHMQQRNLCVVGDFFPLLRWRFILTAQLAQISFLQYFTN